MEYGNFNDITIKDGHNNVYISPEKLAEKNPDCNVYIYELPSIPTEKLKESKGIAKATDTTAVLRVSFFRPFYADYRILMLDKNYTYALVGSNSDNYLWILSRTKRLSSEEKNKLLQEARKRGYKTENLIWVKHSSDAD